MRYAAKNSEKFTMGFGCYGMPIGLEVKIKRYADVWKEGKRKRYCRTCVKLAVEDFRKALIAELKKVGAR